MAIDIAKLAIEETARQMAANLDREMAEKAFGIRFIVDPQLDKTAAACKEKFSDGSLYFPHFEGPVIGFRNEVLDESIRGFEMTGDLSFADLSDGGWYGEMLKAEKAIPRLPAKSWHNELVRLCDQSAKGITVHVASKAQLDSVRETAKRLRRPDIVFEVAPDAPKSEEIEKI